MHLYDYLLDSVLLDNPTGCKSILFADAEAVKDSVEY
jgi:hypothetical protein